MTFDKMWTEEELSELLGDGQKVGLTDPDTVPDERATDITRGDLFELGQHRLLCGDSTKAEDVARVMNNRRADVCLTDPPYGIELDYESFEDSKQNVAVIALKWLPLARENADVVVFSPGVTRQWLYPEPDWVLCWFYAGGPLRSPWGFNCWQPFLAYGKDPSLSRGKGCRPDAVDMNTPANSQNLNHPCPKPIQLWQWLIERITFDYDALLFDPFCGSGTTLIACEQLKRRCSALEIEPRYVQVAIDRWEEFTGQKAVKVNS